jgi:DNA helicase II / ATP-dependent DNA helicase PcrA
VNQFQTTLRPTQEDILSYERGMMGISAVPGSGKTWTLSLLAAKLLAKNLLTDDQEILIVTLVNSAVDNFYQRIRGFLNQFHQFPFGYRVRTLHGLAHDIVRERPEILGLDNNFQIVDEREASLIRNEAASSWLASNPNFLDDYLIRSLEDYQLRKIKRNELLELIQEISMGVIRSAKNKQLNPDELIAKSSSSEVSLPLAEMGIEIYSNYQRALMYRGAVDFDDLIRLAIRALELDSDLLGRLRHRWPIILEDEAQDSSMLQEYILRILVGPEGNWVRVGDPNQAIYETFTTASPKYLHEFINDPAVVHKELPHSGRSTPSIINLANQVVHWTQELHPISNVRDALYSPPDIQPTPEGDPQPNPPDEPDNIHLILHNYKPDKEIEVVANSLQGWLPNNQDQTVAVLVPRNTRADQMVDALKRRRIPYDDSLLQISSGTRSSIDKINRVLSYLADPLSTQKLADVYKYSRQDKVVDENFKKCIHQSEEIIRRVTYIENYLWPSMEKNWLEDVSRTHSDPEIVHELIDFRSVIQRWQGSIILPIDQIILTISQDLFSSAGDLAIAQKIAVLLRRAEQDHPEWRLPDFIQELDLIVKNQRRHLGFSDHDHGFNPENYKGIVVVATMHKAKGLEWDRVYLLSVNNYDFPGDPYNDPFIAEKWFIRDQLNLQAESLAQLDSLLQAEELSWYEEGQASMNSRIDYIRERLRLFYVGITRAKKDLIITWNTGRQNNLKPAISFKSLYDYWLTQRQK